MPYSDLKQRKAYHKAYHLGWYEKHRTARMIKTALYYQKTRTRIFDHYGWFCTCCGESEPEFLTIDHINGGGNEHARRVGTGYSIYLDIIREGFPSTYQTLCMNCNLAKHKCGVCPHETALKAVVA